MDLLAHWNRNPDDIAKVVFPDLLSALNSALGFLRKYPLITKTRDKEFPCQFEPVGWKQNGGLFVTYMNTPANTLPIIWGEKDWYPLFQRFYNPWDEGSSKGFKLACKNENTYKCSCSLSKDIVDVENKALNSLSKPLCKLTSEKDIGS